MNNFLYYRLTFLPDFHSLDILHTVHWKWMKLFSFNPLTWITYHEFIFERRVDVAEAKSSSFMARCFILYPFNIQKTYLSWKQILLKKILDRTICNLLLKWNLSLVPKEESQTYIKIIFLKKMDALKFIRLKFIFVHNIPLFKPVLNEISLLVVCPCYTISPDIIESPHCALGDFELFWINFSPVW